MPILTSCSYTPPLWFPGGHVQTILPRLLCPAPHEAYIREQVETPDGDFFTMDWLYAKQQVAGRDTVQADKLVILSHGLEGTSRSQYMRFAAQALVSRGWDVAARNYRACGGGSNRLPRFYHSGETGDLQIAIQHGQDRGYKQIGLVGFSVGGNQVLKYLGEAPSRVPSRVHAAVAVSAPCDLYGCSIALAKRGNRVYMEYFMHSLRQKIREKQKRFPELFSLQGLDAMTTFKAFDDAYTAPLNGFADAEDYWRKASSGQFLHAVRVPSLMISARNDPFLSESCYPVAEATANPSLFLLMPEQGGHVSFPDWPGVNPSWLYRTIADFLEQWTIENV